MSFCYTQVTVEETETQKRGKDVTSPRVKLQVIPTASQLQIPCFQHSCWELGLWGSGLSSRGPGNALETVDNRCHGLAQVRGDNSVGIKDMGQTVAEEDWSG